ncbi:MAG: amidohydrolase family protein [Planctomycetaceae bacterium]
MMPPPFDLLIRSGRIVCPRSGRDAPGTIAIQDGLIAAIDPPDDTTATQTLDLPDTTLLPGLVDLHAHPAKSGSKYGVDPDSEFLPRGVTTVLSQGDAGADNWAEYRDETIHGSRTRVRLAISISWHGEAPDRPCLDDLDWLDVDACIAAIQDGGPLIWGIAINCSRASTGRSDPRLALDRALAAARATDRPLLYGLRQPDDWSFADQLDLLRPGDVVTYSYRREPLGIVAAGHVRPEVIAARERGVLFDVGHGMASLDFNELEAALGDGFPPDTISTDGYARHVDSVPQHDLPRTMSKLLAAGMPENDIFRAVTSRPASVLGLADTVGGLRPGTPADLTLLAFHDDSAPLVDVHDQTRPGGCWQAVLTVCGGEPVG